MSAAAVPIVLTAVGVGATVYSTIRAGRAESKAESERATQEARAAERAREIAAQRAEDEEKRHKAIIATQEARYAASGVTMEGSPLLVQMESLKESEEQLRRIREGGEVEYMTHKELAQAAGRRAGEARRSGYVTALAQGAGGTYNIGKSFDWW